MNSRAYVILKFVVSVLVPFLLKFIEPNATISTKAILGIGIFLGWSSIDLLTITGKLLAAHKRETELWEMEHSVETSLNNIRKHYREIAKDFFGSDDLFKDYFERTFSALADDLQHAAEKKELYVKDYHFQNTDRLLSAFNGDQTGILRYVWVISKTDPLFDQKWTHYCTQIDEGLKKGVIKEIRALLVVADSGLRSEPQIQQIAGFYAHTKGYQYRTIDQAAYNQVQVDQCLEQQYIDFGLYGRRYIYRTISYGEETTGRFCKDTAVIDRYTKFFDIVWGSHSAMELDKSKLPKVKLAEVLSVKW